MEKEVSVEIVSQNVKLEPDQSDTDVNRISDETKRNNQSLETIEEVFENVPSAHYSFSLEDETTASWLKDSAQAIGNKVQIAQKDQDNVMGQNKLDNDHQSNIPIRQILIFLFNFFVQFFKMLKTQKYNSR